MVIDVLDGFLGIAAQLVGDVRRQQFDARRRCEQAAGVMLAQQFLLTLHAIYNFGDAEVPKVFGVAGNGFCREHPAIMLRQRFERRDNQAAIGKSRSRWFFGSSILIVPLARSTWDQRSSQTSPERIPVNSRTVHATCLVGLLIARIKSEQGQGWFTKARRKVGLLPE